MKRFLYSVLCLCACLSLNAQVKYVFYFIGDGMGPNQVLATEMYLAELQGKIGRNRLGMTQLPYSGQLATFSASNGITDSSAAGTALATGSKANNGSLGLNAKGDTLTSIAEQLKAEGWGVGLLTTVAIDHATPAAFYANVESRNDYYEIGRQLAYTGFDFFGGAGFHNPDPKYKDGKKDKKGKKKVTKQPAGSPNLYDLAEQQGYTIASGYKQALEKSKQAEKLILVQPTDGIDRSKKGSNFPYCIDGREDELSLKLLTNFATEFLQSRNSRFFLMVEGGMIDYACHGRDGAAAIQETLDFDGAIGFALEFYENHPDETLIIVTADHETGGMALGNSDYTLDLQLLRHQHCSAGTLSDELNELYKDNRQPEWDEVRALLEKRLELYTAVTVEDDEDEELRDVFKKTVEERDDADVKTLYKDINALSNAAIALLNKKAKMGWTSYSHTAAAVPIFAIGKGAELFTGWQDNTDVAPKIIRLTR